MALHDESEMTIINNKNIIALHEALKIERKRGDQLEKNIADAMRAVSQLQQEMADLRTQTVNMLNARM